MRILYCFCGEPILFEDCDFDLAKHFSWNCSGQGLRVQGWVHGKMTTLTHLLRGTPVGGKVWDHIDRNCHNNLHSNLRLATFAQNLQNKNVYKNNKSGVSGVCWVRSEQVWHVTVSKGGRKKHVGRFTDKNKAIQARIAAAKVMYGEFAPSHEPQALREFL